MMGGRFSHRRDLVPDGYRDVSVSVLYTHPSSNLSIIGEIQVKTSSGFVYDTPRLFLFLAFLGFHIQACSFSFAVSATTLLALGENLSPGLVTVHCADVSVSIYISSQVSSSLIPFVSVLFQGAVILSLAAPFYVVFEMYICHTLISVLTIFNVNCADP